MVQEEVADATEPPLPPDPSADNLERLQGELTTERDHFASQAREEGQTKERWLLTEKELADVTARLQTLQSARTAAERPALDNDKGVQTAALSLADVESRIRLVNAEMDGIKKLPSVKRSLRYQTPVSQPLQTEELFFECHGGHITLIDVGAMLEQVRRERDDKAKLLATQWQIEGTTGPVGAFRMHYILEHLSRAKAWTRRSATRCQMRGSSRASVGWLRRSAATAARQAMGRWPCRLASAGVERTRSESDGRHHLNPPRIAFLFIVVTARLLARTRFRRGWPTVIGRNAHRQFAATTSVTRSVRISNSSARKTTTRRLGTRHVLHLHVFVFFVIRFRIPALHPSAFHTPPNTCRAFCSTTPSGSEDVTVFVPAGQLQPVADVLLVERRRTTSSTPSRRLARNARNYPASTLRPQDPSRSASSPTRTSCQQG